MASARVCSVYDYELQVMKTRLIHNIGYGEVEDTFVPVFAENWELVQINGSPSDPRMMDGYDAPQIGDHQERTADTSPLLPLSGD